MDSIACLALEHRIDTDGSASNLPMDELLNAAQRLKDQTAMLRYDVHEKILIRNRLSDMLTAEQIRAAMRSQISETNRKYLEVLLVNFFMDHTPRGGGEADEFVGEADLTKIEQQLSYPACPGDEKRSALLNEVHQLCRHVRDLLKKQLQATQQLQFVRTLVDNVDQDQISKTASWNGRPSTLDRILDETSEVESGSDWAQEEECNARLYRQLHLNPSPVPRKEPCALASTSALTTEVQLPWRSHGLKCTIKAKNLASAGEVKFNPDAQADHPAEHHESSGVPVSSSYGKVTRTDSLEFDHSMTSDMRFPL
mmetsp:Transcript_22401/g.42715  ORF Transcript_22401/g.42715 Transcript_22401/m.42715 type:complete len:311 (+) Transcript_22401:219-1151(+)